MSETTSSLSRVQVVESKRNKLSLLSAAVKKYLREANLKEENVYFDSQV
jgi:hypothetical protein